MTNYMASGMGGQPQPQPTAPSQGQASTSMSMNVSPEKRSALKNYFDGYKDAIQRNTLTNQMSESMDQLLPNISSPQMPMQQPMMPQQPPMMMNMGGAVDVFEPKYMSNGGFLSNISVGEGDTIGGRDEKDENDYVESLLNEYDDMYPTSQPASDNNSGSNLFVDQQIDDALNFAENNSPLSAPLNVGSMPLDLASSGDFQGSGNFNPNYDSTFVNIDDATEELSNMGKFEKGLANIFGGVFNKARDDAGNITPLGYADLLAQTRSTAARNKELEDQRRKDQDDRERQLAEEQRMRALIQSMMPVATEATPTEETAPIAETPPVADPVNYQDVVVPSDRVPNFSIPPLPVLPSTSPLLPQGISPELLRNLFKLQGVPASQMNQGGSVNKLDTAVDNFLSSVR